MPTEAEEKGIAPTIRDGQKRLAEGAKDGTMLPPEQTPHYRRLDKFKRRLEGLLIEVEKEMTEIKSSF